MWGTSFPSSIHGARKGSRRWREVFFTPHLSVWSHGGVFSFPTPSLKTEIVWECDLHTHGARFHGDGEPKRMLMVPLWEQLLALFPLVDI